MKRLRDSVTRFFSVGFFLKKLLLVPLEVHLDDFGFCRISTEIFNKMFAQRCMIHCRMTTLWCILHRELTTWRCKLHRGVALGNFKKILRCKIHRGMVTWRCIILRGMATWRNILHCGMVTLRCMTHLNGWASVVERGVASLSGQTVKVLVIK